MLAQLAEVRSQLDDVPQLLAEVENEPELLHPDTKGLLNKDLSENARLDQPNQATGGPHLSNPADTTDAAEHDGDTDEAKAPLTPPDVVWEGEGYLKEVSCTRAWEWIHDTVRFELKQAEEACIAVIGADQGVVLGGGVDYDRLLDGLPARVVARVMANMSKHLKRLNDDVIQYRG